MRNVQRTFDESIFSPTNDFYISHPPPHQRHQLASLLTVFSEHLSPCTTDKGPTTTQRNVRISHRYNTTTTPPRNPDQHEGGDPSSMTSTITSTWTPPFTGKSHPLHICISSTPGYSDKTTTHIYASSIPRLPTNVAQAPNPYSHSINFPYPVMTVSCPLLVYTTSSHLSLYTHNSLLVCSNRLSRGQVETLVQHKLQHALSDWFSLSLCQQPWTPWTTAQRNISWLHISEPTSLGLSLRTWNYTLHTTTIHPHLIDDNDTPVTSLLFLILLTVIATILTHTCLTPPESAHLPTIASRNHHSHKRHPRPSPTTAPTPQELAKTHAIYLLHCILDNLFRRRFALDTTIGTHTLRTGRGYRGTTRQRLRFRDSEEWHRHLHITGLTSETEAFCATLRTLVPGATPRPRSTRARTVRSRRHRKEWHRRNRTRLSKAYKLRQRTTRSTGAFSRPPPSRRPKIHSSPTGHRNRLLGGAPQTPECHPDEPLFQYYVMHVHLKSTTPPTQGATYKVLNQSEFESLSRSRQFTEFAKLGFQFDCPEALLLQLLPLGSEICKLYTEYELPALQVPHLTLQEALCHTRILTSQIQKLSYKRKHLQRELATLHKRNRKGSIPAIAKWERKPPMTNTQLTLELYRVRHVISQHRDTLEAIQKRYKST